MAIVIIADDLSGAAELAGVAFARGYSAEVQRRFEPSSAAEVIAVDTDSRGLPPAAAADRVRSAASTVLAANPAWIFKKVDSILRGNVRAEIQALLRVTGQERAILVPANPSLGRTIAGGNYLIDGVHLHHTALASDPNHPRTSAQVQELLGGEMKWTDLSVPDVSTLEELRGVTGRLESDTLVAGAADFFTSLLEHRGSRPGAINLLHHGEILRPALLVCGSRASWDLHAARCAAVGVPVRTFPVAFAGKSFPGDELPACADRAASRLISAGRLALGIGPLESAARPAELVARLAELTALILERVPVATLLLEGGATAAAVVERLNWRRLEVTSSLDEIGVLQPFGVPQAPRVWIKPGSYPWPEAVWRSLQ